ncbi:MAG: cold shock domain-containing protein [Dermatophilus congolensis]|nr:cold shock domain-containing protein [Dermatophilus congolensis]
MPTGKVKWYDADKGFGFVTDDAGGDVFLHANSLPEGTATVRPGTRIEFSVAQGRRGAQAMQVTIVSEPPSVAQAQHAKHRPDPEKMTVIVEDLIKLLDGVSTQLHKGRYPDKAVAGKVAAVLRAVADDLDGG